MQSPILLYFLVALVLIWRATPAMWMQRGIGEEFIDDGESFVILTGQLKRGCLPHQVAGWGSFSWATLNSATAASYFCG